MPMSHIHLRALFFTKFSLGPNTTISQLKSLMEEKGVGSILVTDKGNQLLGIVTGRDIRFEDDLGKTVDKVSQIICPSAFVLELYCLPTNRL